MFRAIFFSLVIVVAVTACKTNRLPDPKLPDHGQVDGFSEVSYEKILSKLEKNKVLAKSLQLESEWLRLRALVVEAEKYSCECRTSELELATEMARFGSFDQRLPDGGFINDEQRTRWNAQLEVKKSTRITAEARANLLRRDLDDLKEKIIKEGYQVPVDSVIQ